MPAMLGDLGVLERVGFVTATKFVSLERVGFPTSTSLLVYRQVQNGLQTSTTRRVIEHGASGDPVSVPRDRTSDEIAL